MAETLASVPLLDLKLQYSEIRAEIASAVTRVIESQGFILGPEVEKFEQAAASYCQSKFSVGVSSGTDALLLALMALEVSTGDEVITSPYSFFATAGSISRSGAKPVFADIIPDTFNIDPEEVEKKIGPKTKAIMPVHLFGLCADMEQLGEISSRRQIPLIEDAAQGIGASLKTKQAGSFGLMGCFSFFPSKNLGAFGDAGMVTTSDSHMVERLRKLRVHGGMQRYYHDEVGGNFRIDALQAAVLSVKLPHLDKWSQARQRNAALYTRLFTDAGLTHASTRTPSSDSPVVLPTEAPGYTHVYNQFVVRVSQRDKLQEHLTATGVGNAIYYPLCLHQQECFRNLGYKKGDFPESERAASETLALPIFPELKSEQIEWVVAHIEEFYRG